MTIDHAAQLSEKDYVALLIEHAQRLRKLGPQPLAVTCANDKFNDAFDDDFWCAVQVGGSYWEQSQFFHTASREQSIIALNADTGGHQIGSSLYGVAAITEGRKILASLEKRQWRQVGKDSIARNPGVAGIFPWDNIYALIIQHDQVWLWIGAPMNDKNILYACHPSGLIFVGLDTHRMDEIFGALDLLYPEPFQQAALPFLTPKAQAYFRPRVVDEGASAEFAHFVHDALTQLRHLTTEPIHFWLDPWQISGNPYFSVGSEKYSKNDIVGAPEPVPSIAKIIDSLDHTRLRTLFEQATSLDTSEDSRRGLAVNGTSGIAFALRDQSVTIAFGIFIFSLDRAKGLKFEGYSRRRMDGSSFDGHTLLALVDSEQFEPVAFQSQDEEGR